MLLEVKFADIAVSACGPAIVAKDEDDDEDDDDDDDDNG